MVKICVSGSKGKMGSRILELAAGDGGFVVSGSFDMGEDPKAPIGACDCLIEFTTPEATMEHLALCEELKKAVVIGTTGLSENERKRIEEAAVKIPVVFSPNMSIGVNLLFKMVADAAKVLGGGYAVDIVEAHHVEKKDAPSGTAKEMARIVKEAKGGIDVPVESIREDEIVGEHTIKFESDLDVIEITHSAKTRDIFAQGALSAAKWVAAKKPGLYTMRDVLAL